MTTAKVVCLADVPDPDPEVLKAIESGYRRGFIHGIQAVIDGNRAKYRSTIIHRYRDFLMETWRYGSGFEIPPTMDDFRSLTEKRRSVSLSLRWAVLKRDKFTCVYCGLVAGAGVQLSIDHVVPLCDGGTNDIENLATACRECNTGKGVDVLEHSEITEGVK